MEGMMPWLREYQCIRGGFNVALVRKLDAVRKQVGDDLANPTRISQHHQVVLDVLRDVGPEIEILP